MGFFDKLFGKKEAAAFEPTSVTPERAGDAQRVISGHAGHISAVGFVLGGKLLLTADAKGNIAGWRVPSWERHLSLSHQPPSPTYCFASGTSGDVYYGRGAAVKQWKVGPGFIGGDLTQLQSFTLGNAHTREVVPVLKLAERLVSGGYDGNLYFWDVESGSAQGGSLGSAILSLSCTAGLLYSSEDSGFVTSGHEDGTVTIFDTGRMQPLANFRAHDRDVYAVSFQNVMATRKMLIATCSPSDRRVRVWDKSECAAEFEAPGFTAAFSPDGRFLVHGDGNDVVVREAREWKVVRRLKGHGGLISALAFPPMTRMEDLWDGMLATGSHDGTVRVWTVDEAQAGTRAPTASSGAARTPPAEWGWARVHVRDAGLKAVGYYYRDAQAGPSFNILHELGPDTTTEQVRAHASRVGFRGDRTFRLGAHETINVDGLPADFVTFMKTRYEAGNGATGVVMKLTAAERTELGLPAHPEWIAHYL